MGGTYLDFLRGKIQVAPKTGFEVGPEQVNAALKPHQRDAVIWACRGGRRALFESFGLGKTVQELEWCRLTAAHEGGQALIVLPLGVRQEFSRDAERLLGMAPPALCAYHEGGGGMPGGAHPHDQLRAGSGRGHGSRRVLRRGAG